MSKLILIVLLVGAIVGFCQGAFKQIANLVGIVAGFIVAAMLSSRLGDFLSTQTGASESMGKIVAFVVIFFLFPILLGWIAALLTKLFSAVHLGFVNRICGAFVGVISFCLMMSLGFNLMDFAMSNAGFNQAALEQREDIYYIVKHISQPFVPDIFIVDDYTEVERLAEDETPRCGLKPKVDEAIDNVTDKLNPFKN